MVFLKKTTAQRGDNINSSQALAIYSQTPRYEADLVETAREEAPDPFLAGNRKVIDNIPYKCQVYIERHSSYQAVSL